VKAAGEAIGDIAEGTWDWIRDNADDVYRVVKEYGCAIVNNDIVVTVAATGAGIVASPAASAAVVTGAAVGRTGCAVLELSEAVYAILKLLSSDFSSPPPLSSDKPPETPPVPPPAGPPGQGGPETGMKLLFISKAVPISGRIVIPAQPVLKALVEQYPPGTVARFHKQKKVWYIYLPKAGGLGDSFLGAPPPDQVLPDKPQDPNVREGSPINEFYKNPWFWAAVVATLAVGGTTFIVVRRRRRAVSMSMYRYRRGDGHAPWRY
jgi:hypothetical protein